jgi:hypothetical protein
LLLLDEIEHPTAITPNQWHFFAASVDANGRARIMLDDSMTFGSLPAGALTLSTTTIGALRRSGFDPQVPFGGRLDDIRVYSRILSYSELMALYQGEQGTGSGKYSLGSNLTVNGNLSLYSGTLDPTASSFSISASGSFLNNARYVQRQSVVTLSGIGTALKMFGTSIYDLTVASAKSAPELKLK